MASCTGATQPQYFRSEMREPGAAAVLRPPDDVLDASATREAVEDAGGGSLAPRGSSRMSAVAV